MVVLLINDASLFDDLSFEVIGFIYEPAQSTVDATTAATPATTIRSLGTL